MRLSYANITSTLALVVALGGTGAYAAGTIGSSDIKANAVRSTHIKNGQVKAGDLARGSVNSAKVANGSLLAADFKAGEIAKGQATTVPSGKTLYGTWAISASNLSEFAITGVSFGQRFAVAPVAHYIPKDGVAPAQCPGNEASPAAQPGHLCVYEAVISLGTPGGVVFNPVTDEDNSATRFGFGVYALGSGQDAFYLEGTWAATAP